MRVLLTNDDGYLADGICRLADEVSSWAEVTVVAPDRERSGSSRSITLHHPLRLRELDRPPAAGTWHVVNGTPTDCVNLALHFLLAGETPDLVVSGINHGLNLGDDVFYSGTVAAACEARHFDLPAVALSQEPGGRTMEESAGLCSELLQRLIRAGLDGSLLNVNLPAGEISAYEVTRLGRRVYGDVVVEKTDPRGQAYFWLAGKPRWDESEGNDQQAVATGHVSLTPLRLNLTDELALEPMRQALADAGLVSRGAV